MKCLFSFTASKMYLWHCHLVLLFGTVFPNSALLSKVLKHCFEKDDKWKIVAWNLKWLKSLNDWNVLVFKKLEMVWSENVLRKTLTLENVCAFQNNITFQFDNVICYSDLINCTLFILLNLVDNIKYFVPSSKLFLLSFW